MMEFLKSVGFTLTRNTLDGDYPKGMPEKDR